MTSGHAQEAGFPDEFWGSSGGGAATDISPLQPPVAETGGGEGAGGAAAGSPEPGGGDGSTGHGALSWRSAWQREQEELASRRVVPEASTIPVTVMRSVQLDAQRLDEELKGMLAEQLHRALAIFNPDLISRVQPELLAFMDFTFFWFTIWRDRPTPGMRLMNLRFRDERPPPAGPSLPSTALRSGIEGPGLSSGQKVAFGLLYVGGRYVRARMQRAAVAQHWMDAGAGTWQHRSWRAMTMLDNAHEVARLGNLLMFLSTGKYRTLLERALSARLFYTQVSMQRAVSFDFLNRQLVWQELSELILNVLPIINPDKIRSIMLRWMSPPAGPAGPHQQGFTSVLPHLKAAPPCGVCGSGDVLVPFFAVPCGHVFCYYCLRCRTQHDRHFLCPLCGSRVQALRRHGQPPSNSSSPAAGAPPRPQ